MLKERSWGDDIFGGFPKLTDEEIKARKEARIMRDVGYILSNESISKSELVEIIQASK